MVMGENFRSRSYGGSRMQMELYGGEGRGRREETNMHDMRSYSANYAYYPQQQVQKEPKLKKGKSMSFINDPELQRKKRVAVYKVYGMEGRVKGSLRRSFRWLKDRYTQVVYGWW